MLTYDQHLAIYRGLDREATKAAKALAKARAAYDSLPTSGTYRAECAAMLTLREAQSAASRKVVTDYFDAHIKNAT